VAGSHDSSVHALLSSQSGGEPPTQEPPEHLSAVVHALPSSQDSVLFECLQPLAGSQLSSVQPLLSLQLGGGPPTQFPLEQWSLVVHALPSLQAAVLSLWTHPVAGLQESSVHTSPSLQLGAGPPTQLPPEHLSAVVHALPSSQDSVLFECVQPLAGLQASVVQTLLSSQLGGGPPVQLPAEQWSPVVQELWSSQGLLLFTCLQPVAASQLSVVQRLLSSQLMGVPAQLPLTHLSPLVQALLSSQGVLSGCDPSGGQAFVVPSQTSATSH
jgi:hypothetical protein